MASENPPKVQFNVYLPPDLVRRVNLDIPQNDECDERY